MGNRRRVVITGAAPLCSLGNSREEMFKNLCERRKVLKRIEKNTPPLMKLRSEWVTPYPDLESDGKYVRELYRIKTGGSKSAYAAAKASLLALEDAGIKRADENTSVFIGTDSMSMEELSHHIIQFNSTQKMNVMMLPIVIQNAIASWVTIVLGTHGISSVVNMACASSTAAVGFGYESIMSGKCDMSVCGGTSLPADENLTILKGFEYVKCVTTDKNGNAYPFSEERAGFLFSEGAACSLVLEELCHAKNRGAEILAEITGFETSSDAYDILSMDETGKYATDMLNRLIGDQKIDYYNAHGTATMLNDKVEAAVIHETFGGRDSQPAINATKAFLGNTFGAGGALEALVCVESIRQNKVHGNICGTLLPDLNISEQTRELNVERTVTASFGFGGHNAALMIERYGG